MSARRIFLALLLIGLAGFFARSFGASEGLVGPVTLASGEELSHLPVMYE